MASLPEKGVPELMDAATALLVQLEHPSLSMESREECVKRLTLAIEDVRFSRAAP